ncbi:MAG: endopeptidase La [Anaerolineales bacterium]|nr:endopeptidase La [Anaerolineales bacterium]
MSQQITEEQNQEQEGQRSTPEAAPAIAPQKMEQKGATSDGRASGEPTLPTQLPILPLRNTVVYPQTVLPLSADQARAIRLIEDVNEGDKLIGLVTMTDPSIEVPGPNDVYTIGTMAQIHRLLRVPDGSVRIIIQGLERIRITEWLAEEPYLMAAVEAHEESAESDVEIEALSRNLLDLFDRYVELSPNLPEELMFAANNADDTLQLAYLIATPMRMELEEAQQILEANSVSEKLRQLTRLINQELEVLELGLKIQTEAQGEMERMQREYYLREQIKAIRKELGDSDESELVEDLRSQIRERGMSAEAEEQALRELERMEKMPPQAAEYSVIKSYIDWLLEIPWRETTEDNYDIVHAREVLDADHYDLEDVKDRIIEYLAVRKLARERGLDGLPRDQVEGEAAAPQEAHPSVRPGSGVILALVGPPGVGKTSLGRSIARALGRNFTRMSLGGMRDEAELRGHRRTYIGAMPGRVMQALKREGTRNPVFMLDEIDKLGRDFRGDPTSALLEVLDPQQNSSFRDYYLDVDFDLSAVMFVATANELEPIPPPLRDRMEIIRLDGYTEGEKLHIARGYLIPRQLEANALRDDEITFTEAALSRMIEDYTREAGVRNLERQIGSIMRKVATQVARGEVHEPVEISADNVPEFLGKQKFFAEVRARTAVPGVATGLAATAVGGDILFIEATRMRGEQKLTITGQLGDVMKESATIAHSFVRSKLAPLGIPADELTSYDMHLHVPAGATPKDGPSAGVTLVTAIVSLLTHRPVHSNVGMTGEVTLRGRVLPVGGIKQKVLAAYRAGLDTIILPRRNEADLDDLPAEVREAIRFVLVDDVGEVLSHALADPIDPARYNASLNEVALQHSDEADG